MYLPPSNLTAQINPELYLDLSFLDQYRNFKPLNKTITVQRRILNFPLLPLQENRPWMNHATSTPWPKNIIPQKRTQESKKIQKVFKKTIIKEEKPLLILLKRISTSSASFVLYKKTPHIRTDHKRTHIFIHLNDRFNSKQPNSCYKVSHANINYLNKIPLIDFQKELSKFLHSNRH